MDIPDSDSDEERIIYFHEGILDDHSKILDEDDSGSYIFDFFENKMSTVRILDIVLSGNQLSQDDKIKIIKMVDGNNGNLLLHILSTIEFLDSNISNNIINYNTMLMNILEIYPESFIMINQHGDSPFFFLLRNNIFETTTQDILLKFNELNKIDEILSIQDGEGDTPLHILLNKKRNELIRFILHRFFGDFLYIKNNDEKTLLHLCCSYDLNIEIGNLLLDKGVRITKGHEGNTPLHYLLTIHYHNIDLNFVERLLRAPLHQEIISQQPEAKNILDVKDINGFTAVVKNLSVFTRPELLSLLLKYGLNVNDQDPENGDNLLFRCIRYGNFESFQLLMNEPTLRFDLSFNYLNSGFISPFKICIISLLEIRHLVMVAENVTVMAEEQEVVDNFVRMYALLLQRGMPNDLHTFSNEETLYHEKILKLVRATILQVKIGEKIMLYSIKSSSDNIFPLIHMIKNFKQLGDVILIAKVLKINYEMKNIEEIKEEIIKKLLKILGKKQEPENPNEPPSLLSIRDLFLKIGEKSIGQISKHSSKNLESPKIFLDRFNKLFSNLDSSIKDHFTEEQELYISLLDTGIELEHEDKVYEIHEETKKKINQKRNRDPWRRSRGMYKRTMPMASSRSGGSKKSKKRTRKKLKKSHKKLKKTNKRSKRISKRNNKKKL